MSITSFGEEIPGMEGLGTGEHSYTVKVNSNNYIFFIVLIKMTIFLSDITVICPWEAYSHLELHELAQYGIIWISSPEKSFYTHKRNTLKMILGNYFYVIEWFISGMQI